MLDQWVPSQIGVGHQRADAHPPVSGAVDGFQRQMRDIYQPRRLLDVVFHEVKQVGAACNEFRRGIGRDLPNRVRDVAGLRVLEIDHDVLIACWIAATMLG